MMKSRRLPSKGNSTTPTLLPTIVFLLIVVSFPGVLFPGDSLSSSSSSSLAVLAFPLPPITPSKASVTRIRSARNDDVNTATEATNPRKTPNKRSVLFFQSKSTPPPQPPLHTRRTLLSTAAFVASSLCPRAATAATTTPAETKLTTLEAARVSAEGATLVLKKAKGGGLARAIRVGLRFKMDELQRDLMQERWDLLQAYPAQLRSYVYIFTTYTDAAFPSDSPTDKDLRVALRYEVGRFYGSLERLKKAIAKQSLDEAYTAYADMSLHFDRYLRSGGLYTYYDSVVDNEIYFKGTPENALVYSDPIKDPAEVRDLIVLCMGPNKGKTGILIGIYPPTRVDDGTGTAASSGGSSSSTTTSDCVVKLDEYRGMREILVVPRSWAAKRLGEQSPDAVFLIPRKE